MVSLKAFPLKKQFCHGIDSARTDGRGVDAVLGPEMRSTGEVMGISKTFGESYAKISNFSLWSSCLRLARFFSFADKDKESALPSVKRLFGMGFTLFATAGLLNSFITMELQALRCANILKELGH
jgi:carbamoyl-phosphate synthase large subunit